MWHKFLENHWAAVAFGSDNVRPTPYGVLMTTAAVLADPGTGAAAPAGDPLDVARAAVTQALQVGVWSRSEPELVADLRETLALRAQVDALLLAQISEVDSRGVARRRGCPSTRAWLRTAHRIGPGEASVLVKTATALRDDLPAVAAALAAGELSWPRRRCVWRRSPTSPLRRRWPAGRRPKPA